MVAACSLLCRSWWAFLHWRCSWEHLLVVFRCGMVIANQPHQVQSDFCWSLRSLFSVLWSLVGFVAWDGMGLCCRKANDSNLQYGSSQWNTGNHCIYCGYTICTTQTGWKVYWISLHWVPGLYDPCFFRYPTPYSLPFLENRELAISEWCTFCLQWIRISTFCNPAS